VIKKIFISAIYFLTCFYSNSQQPVLSVQRFEYIYLPNTDVIFEKIVFASYDTLKKKIETSFAKAIQDRWNVTMQEARLSVKPLSLFSWSGTPRFNTKLKDKQPGVWYLFLQILDRSGSPFDDTDSSETGELELKCKLVNGSNDSVILDRILSVIIYKTTVPKDQVVLTKLLAYPADFVNAFDSIATWLFQPEYEIRKSVWLKPACVFIDTKIPVELEPIKQLQFKSNSEQIELLTEPGLLFQTQGPEYKKTDVHHNTGGNIATGAATIFTGVNINKAKVNEYLADFAFEEKDSTYHCIINYAERVVAERKREITRDSDGSRSYSLSSKSYTLDARHIIPGYSNAITLNNDTLAAFDITYKTNAKERYSYTRFWDGTDSATITTLPNEWNNKTEDDNIIITGKIEDSSFVMKTASETTRKEFYINDKLVMIVYGKKYPSKALLFQSLSARQLKAFTILSALPYSYFNY
jgi:hypothetical protein